MKLSAKLLSTTAFVLALSVSQPLHAADTTPGDSTITEQSNSADSPAENQDLSFSAERLINHVSNALLYLNSGANDKAYDEVTAARKIAVALKDAAPEYTSKRKVQAGRVVYNYKNNESNYYIPLADETYTKRVYKDGPFWSSEKGLAVKKAEVVYVTIKLDVKKAMSQLDKADKQMARNSYKDAEATLASFNKSIVTDAVEADMPLQKARDNFFLARMLVEQKNYRGARYALKNADSALDAASKGDLNADRQTRIKEMHADIKLMQETLKQADPTASEQAAEKLQQWWDETKDWVNKV